MGPRCLVCNKVAAGLEILRSPPAARLFQSVGDFSSMGLGEEGRWAREGGPVLTLGRFVGSASARLFVVGLGWGQWLL